MLLDLADVVLPSPAQLRRASFGARVVMMCSSFKVVAPLETESDRMSYEVIWSVERPLREASAAGTSTSSEN